MMPYKCYVAYFFLSHAKALSGLMKVYSSWYVEFVALTDGSLTYSFNNSADNFNHLAPLKGCICMELWCPDVREAIRYRKKQDWIILNKKLNKTVNCFFCCCNAMLWVLHLLSKHFLKAELMVTNLLYRFDMTWLCEGSFTRCLMTEDLDCCKRKIPIQQITSTDPRISLIIPVLLLCLFYSSSHILQLCVQTQVKTPSYVSQRQLKKIKLL